MTTTNRPIRRALVSVFHKEGIEVLAEAFIKAGTEVVSTGSTAKRLAELGVKVTEVSEVTGFPECLDGRVKTLDPHIHAGILADMTNEDHAAQLEKFGPAAKAAGKSVGLRINPECSTQDGHAIYDPCAPGSRLGTTRTQWDAAVAAEPALPALLDGLHFHTLCEQDADALAVTLDAVADKFGDLLSKMQWLNFGGGHHITRPGYNMTTLERCIRRAHQDWGVTVYLEPGEACALNAGYLLTRVLDVVQNGDTTIAILDTSAACHMPDVIEMPYRPPLLGAGEPGEKACTVRLAGPTCLAGDIIGDYSFDAVPAVGDLLIFGDMAIYTTCKNNTFNGMPLPAIYARRPDGTTREITTFGYSNFKHRVGK